MDIENNNEILFTTEAVGIGHPDKIADQISDAILDECLLYDKNARVACETLITKKNIILAGEITTFAKIDYKTVALNTIIKIGYTNPEFGFDIKNCKIINLIHNQSPELHHNVETEGHLGAGDQGIMFGYATNETIYYMPLAFCVANNLLQKIEKLRKTKILSDGYGVDMKSQVTFDMTDRNHPTLKKILLSVQHDKDLDLITVRKELFEKVIIPVLNEQSIDHSSVSCYINPLGNFHIGGPEADTGLTGRKIIADTYGGFAHHGGGAFSGKDATKVDRTGAYFARYIAKNIVAAKLADKCEIQIGFIIGQSQPASLFIKTFGTNSVSLPVIYKIVYKVFDFNLNHIIEKFELEKPIYSTYSVHGHFGRNLKTAKWEKLDKVVEIINCYKNFD